MVATRTYLTGGIGAHHSDEAFGDPYELPNERSYCETCAAIGSIMFSWRMLLITGEARYADLVERTLYNGFLGGLSLDGSSYIYANPLQVRDGHLAGGHHGDSDYARRPWFSCACCPPNVMRALASLEHYVVMSNHTELRVHQFIPGVYTAAVGGGEATVRISTDYPWDGELRIVVESAPGGRWGLGVRIPHWADRPAAEVNGTLLDQDPSQGWLSVRRAWAVGDELVVELPLDARFTYADSRVDADRGAVALERGPLVYCLEAVDHPGRRLDDIVVDTTRAPVVERGGETPAGVTTIGINGFERPRTASSWWPYSSRAPSRSAGQEARIILTAIPYFVWGNRGSSTMRVWLPAGDG